jgi:GNAT superfamily N-acetyltransferase
MTKVTGLESGAGTPAVNVRRMADGDAAAVAGLLGELGYPILEDGLLLRLAAEGECPSFDVFVLESAGKVVGCLSLTYTPYFADGSVLCRVTALVVASSQRGRGFGALLVAKAVEEGRRHSCSAVELTAADWRADAHRFYERVGFSRTSVRFVRRL